MKINQRKNNWSRHSLLDLSQGTFAPYKTEKKRLSNIDQDSDRSKFFYLTQEVDKSIFNPENRVILIWDSVSTLVTLTEAIVIPLILVLPTEHTSNLKLIELFSSFFYLLDILVKLNTGFYQQGHQNINRRSIFIHYLKKYLILDIYSVVPFPYLVFTFPYFSYFLLLKLIKVRKTYKYFKTIQLLLKEIWLMKILYYLKFLISVVLCIHWLACIWLSIGINDISNQDNSWILIIGINEILDIYHRSVYYVITTTTTLGYGDITPYKLNEIEVSLTILFIGVIIFSFNITSIINLVTESRHKFMIYQEKMINLNIYMESKNLPNFLKYRLRKYLEYTSEAIQSNITEEKILKLLSESLREELFNYTAGGKMIRKCRIFLDLYEGKVIRKLSNYFKNKIFSPNDEVISEGEYSTQVYFLICGKVEIFHSQTKTVFKMLKQGQFFGEISFFTKQPRTASVRCVDMVECLFVKREELDVILLKFPIAASKTKHIEISCGNNDFAILGVKCYLCRGIGHIAKHCDYARISPGLFNIPQTWIRQKNESRAVNPRKYKRNSVMRHVKTPGVFRVKHLAKSIGKEIIDKFNKRESVVALSDGEREGANDGIQRILTSEESIRLNTEVKPVKYRFSILRNYENLDVSELY